MTLGDGERATTRPTVTVVVSHYEQPAQLARALAALARQTFPADQLQVVVADDGSSDPPVVPAGIEVVTQADEGFRVARIRNRAARLARGDVLLFLDADTTPEPDYVARMAAGPAASAAAVVVGRRRHADLSGLAPGDDVAAHGRRHELTEPAWLVEAYRRTHDLRLADETSYRFVIGAVLGCSRSFFEGTGGFDESLTTYGGEDWEWAHRAWTHGAELSHVRDAVAWHDGPSREDRPGWGSDADGRRRLLHETLEVARLVPVPGAAPEALLGGAGDPLVTMAPDLLGDRLVLCVDNLLAALPQARVLLDAARCRSLPDDPRILPLEGDDVLVAPAARSAWRHLHVVRAATGDRAAWNAGTELLRGPGAAERLLVVDGHGDVVASWSTLRHQRRAARRPEVPLTAPTTVAADLTILPPGITAQARWGGWA